MELLERAEAANWNKAIFNRNREAGNSILGTAVDDAG